MIKNTVKFGILGCLLSATTFAGTGECDGDKVTSVIVQADGLIQFNTEKKCPTAQCEISMTDGWNIESRKSVLATLLTAEATGGSVLIKFDATNTPTGCNAWPTSSLGGRWGLPVYSVRLYRN